MPTDLERTFPRRADRDVITHPDYQLADWRMGQLITCTTVELAFSLDGYPQLADDAELGRRVARWRARNPELGAILDAEAALDGLAGGRS
jgi:hypothetical protein